jgi:nucleotidyltransferase substrate binding protein (TIGR01987 family)
MEAKVKELAVHLDITDQALQTLEEILQEPFSIIVRDATIQRFEYTFELAWKLFRKILKVEGIESGSPRQAVRGAYDIRLIEDVDLWFEMLENRNRTSHTYNKQTAEQVFDSAIKLPDQLRPLISQVKAGYLQP